MDIKEWLNRGRKCSNMIDALELQKNKMRKYMLSSACKDYKLAMHRYFEYEDKIDKEIDNIVAVRNEIAELIFHMPYGPSRQILQLRYLCMVDTWDEIADKMHYDLRWIHRRIHPQALCEAEKIRDGITDRPARKQAH